MRFHTALEDEVREYLLREYREARRRRSEAHAKIAAVQAQRAQARCEGRLADTYSEVIERFAQQDLAVQRRTIEMVRDLRRLAKRAG